MGQDMRTSVAYAGLYTYPDIVVVCGELRYVDNRRDTITNPTLIIEVLSPGTEAYDRGLKFAQYRKIESLQEYGLVSQAEERVEVFRRQPNGQWLFSDFVGLDATCVFESIGCRVSLAEIYDKVTLGDPDAGASLGSPNPL
jgi:Uma2 family endonuclease